jgi:hypothetical protein
MEGGFIMTQYREILRLHNMGISQRSIADSCACSRNTVAKVPRRAKEIPEIYEKYADMTESDAKGFMFPGFGGADAEVREYPDFKYVDRELLKHGVNIKLLWTEYCGKCRHESKMPLWRENG